MTATRALVIGVSHYDHLPGPTGATHERTFHLRRLKSAATSATHFAAWLRSEYRAPHAPLAEVRLLLSPSPSERKRLAGEDKRAPAATAANVRAALDDWRKECLGDPDGVAILYAAGHGVLLNPIDTGILLLQDFASDPARLLENAVSIPGIRGGLADAAAPKHQFYFLDACRVRPELASRVTLADAGLPGWDRPLREHAIASPILYGAAADTLAWGAAKRGTIFSQALLEALRVGAVEPGRPAGWVVTDTSLIPPVMARVRELAAEHGVEQTAAVGGQPGGVPFHVFAEPPPARVRLSVAPAQAQDVAYFSLSTEGRSLVERRRGPVTKVVPAGNYVVKVAIDPDTPPFAPHEAAWFVRPTGPEEQVLEVPL